MHVPMPPILTMVQNLMIMLMTQTPSGGRVYHHHHNQGTDAITILVYKIFLITTNYLIVTARFLVVANFLARVFVDDQGLAVRTTQRQARLLLVELRMILNQSCQYQNIVFAGNTEAGKVAPGGKAGTQDDTFVLPESKHCVGRQHGRLTINLQSQ